MKLHESEHVPGFGNRLAVPGGWLYDNGCAAFGFVPDPTAEHVTHGAGGAAAVDVDRIRGEMFTEAIEACASVVNKWMPVSISDQRRDLLMRELNGLRR